MELFKSQLSAKSIALIEANTDLINAHLEKWIELEKKNGKSHTKREVIELTKQALLILQSEKKKNGIKARSLSTTPARERAILKLMTRGIGIKQIKGVVAYKVKEWSDTEYEQHLNPETLFSEKFQKYLEAARDAALKELPKKKSKEPNVYDTIMSSEN